MIPLAFIVALAAATLVLLVIMAIAVARQLQRLANTLLRFQREIDPHLQEIRRDAERAAGRMERLSADGGGPDLEAERATGLRPER